jgi:hypothetical protein
MEWILKKKNEEEVWRVLDLRGQVPPMTPRVCLTTIHILCISFKNDFPQLLFSPDLPLYS